MITSEVKCQLKLILIGESGVGKSSITDRLINKDFKPDHVATIGASFAHTIFEVEGYGSVKVNIWDTAGQERFQSLTPGYYRGAHGALVVYDITKSNGLERARAWKQHLDSTIDSSKVAVMLLANKCDLAKDAVIPKTAEQELQCCGAFRTSAYDNSGIQEAMRELVPKMLAHKLAESLPSEEAGTIMLNKEPTLQAASLCNC